MNRFLTGRLIASVTLPAFLITYTLAGTIPAPVASPSSGPVCSEPRAIETLPGQNGNDLSSRDTATEFSLSNIGGTDLLAPAAIEPAAVAHGSTKGALVLTLHPTPMDDGGSRYAYSTGAPDDKPRKTSLLSNPLTVVLIFVAVVAGVGYAVSNKND